MKTQKEKEKIEKEIKKLREEPWDDYTDYSHLSMVEQELQGFNLAKECILEDVEKIIDNRIEHYDLKLDTKSVIALKSVKIKIKEQLKSKDKEE